MPENDHIDGPEETGPITGSDDPAEDDYNYADEPVHSDIAESERSRKPVNTVAIVAIVAIVAVAVMIIAAIVFMVSGGDAEEGEDALAPGDTGTSQTQDPADEQAPPAEGDQPAPVDEAPAENVDEERPDEDESGDTPVQNQNPVPPVEGEGDPQTGESGESSASGVVETFASGPMRVGTDIAPGVYRSSGAEGDMCYWARQSTESTEPALEEITDFGLVPGGQEITVTVEPTDVVFVSEYCGQWTKVG